MENHPIPQDITGFQFKLIGDMTIKQFAYLATGVVIGWIVFAMPIFFLIKIPIAMLSVLAGIGTAFFPVGGRPLDTMIANFLKVLFNPTQYIYKKTGGQIWFPQTQTTAIKAEPATARASSDEKLRNFLSSLPQKPRNKLDEKETAFFASLSSISSNTSAQTQNPQTPSSQKPAQNAAKKTEEVKAEVRQAEKNKQADTEALVLRRELDEAKMQEKTEVVGTPKYQAVHQKVLELEKLLSDVLSQKQALEGRILDLQKRIEMQRQNVYSPTTAVAKEETQKVRKIPKIMGKGVGTPIVPDIPNLITGVVKDPRGNPLVNILVEIKDNSGNPVRAFKTNPLGQFASATPLANGIYTIFFDDPGGQNKFDNVELNIIGEVLMPLEVTSVDTREELRRTLFN